MAAPVSLTGYLWAADWITKNHKHFCLTFQTGSGSVVLNRVKETALLNEFGSRFEKGSLKVNCVCTHSLKHEHMKYVHKNYFMHQSTDLIWKII